MTVVQWLPRSRDLLPSTKPHSSSQNHIRRVVPSRVWAVGLFPESFLGLKWIWVMGFLSHLPNSHVSRLFLMVFKLLFRSLLREQCQNQWFPVGWKAKMSWKCWSSLKWKTNRLCHVWEDGKLLFLSLLVKIRHDVGSTCSSYRAHLWQFQFLTSWDLRTGYPQLFKCWATHPLGSSCFS